MTLLEFLNARLNEDEAAARAATPGPWVPERKGVLDSDGIEFVEATRRDVSHIARHDPARMLREIAAKRAIIAEHHPIDPCDAHDPATMETEPCNTLRALASVYSDYPDYQQEWKP